MTFDGKLRLCFRYDIHFYAILYLFFDMNFTNWKLFLTLQSNLCRFFFFCLIIDMLRLHNFFFNSYDISLLLLIMFGWYVQFRFFSIYYFFSETPFWQTTKLFLLILLLLLSHNRGARIVCRWNFKNKLSSAATIFPPKFSALLDPSLLLVSL